MVELLLDRGANIDQVDKEGEFFYLFIHITINSLEKKKKVIITNLKTSNYLGHTSLYYASENGHLTVVHLLLDRGSNIDLKDYSSEFILSPFFLSVTIDAFLH